MNLLRVLIALLGVLTAHAAFSAEIVAFDQSNPPFMYERNTEVVGLYPDLVAEAFRRMHQPVTLQAIPWTRALAGADRGEWGVGGIYCTTERLQKYDYSEPLYEEVLQVLVLKGREFSFAGLSDLYGKHLGVLRGWSYGNEFDKAVAEGKISTEAVNSDQVNISRLLLGRVDAILMMPESFARISTAADPEARVIVLPHPLTVNKTYLCFAKSSRKIALLERFNAALHSMRTDGTFVRIVNSHLD